MRRHQERLTRANRDLEQFAHSASHDLQEPLRAVAIYSELLSVRSAQSLDEQALLFLGYLQSGARRMEMLVHDLLTYTRTAGVDENVTEAVDAGEQLDVALENLAHALENTNAEITHDSLPPVRMRASRLAGAVSESDRECDQIPAGRAATRSCFRTAGGWVLAFLGFG